MNERRSEPDSIQLLRAVDYAARHHRKQRRKGVEADPYINHPIQVATILAELGGVTDLELLCAAILHDTIEDTGVTPEDLSTAFGPRVALIVSEVTDDKALPKAERKRLQIAHAPHLSPAAQTLKLADKLSNVRDIHLNPPKGWSRERRLEYVNWACAVVDGVRGVNASLERRFDALVREALDALA